MTIGSRENSVILTYDGASYMYYSTTASKCDSLIASGSRYSQINYWILGLPTYRTFQISHNVDTLKVGFYPMDRSTVEFNPENEEKAFYQKTFWSASVLLLIFIVNYI